MNLGQPQSLARILAVPTMSQGAAAQQSIQAQAHTIARPFNTTLHVATGERQSIYVKGSVPLEAPPVQRVISRPAVSAIVPVPQAEPPMPSASQSLRYWGEPPAPPVPQLDVERLTDQVIRTIDQRVVAARERMGKG